eukprot:a174404_1229.p1 GENE.a174404_1229~~a174404_1229.p1  ORF type:complete len:569 (-),score=324.57 a174404_1229:25-1701(-)
MGVLYLLYESAAGYGLFERLTVDEIGEQDDEWQRTVVDLAKFGRVVRMVGFVPFTSAESSLENAHDISDSVVNALLKDFLETMTAKAKAGSFELGVADPTLGGAIQDATGIKCVYNVTVRELLRGVRSHFDKYIPELRAGDIDKAQLGLGHAYSRSKIKFNVNRVDNMIIQSIALLDQMDKGLNTFAMRVKEWYGWHFPELMKIVTDNVQYCRLVIAIQVKSALSEEHLPAIEEIVGDAAVAERILAAARSSMGQDISEIDLLNVTRFAERVAALDNYRAGLHTYLKEKMATCAPNVAALIGEHVGARLISHAGSLTNLAKMPASTVQILGAEKALFRALKTKGNTPKYGLIFHSSFIGRAALKNKGRISRYLANKTSIAARLDAFADVPTAKFGEELKRQVEERLDFYAEGKAPRKNREVMSGVVAELADEVPSPKKRKAERVESDDDEPKAKRSKMETDEPDSKKEKKDKGKEKDKAKDKSKDKAKDKSKDKAKEKDKEKDKAKDKGKEKEKEKEKEKAKDKGKEKEKAKDKGKEKEKEKAKDKGKSKHTKMDESS